MNYRRSKFRRFVGAAILFASLSLAAAGRPRADWITLPDGEFLYDPMVDIKATSSSSAAGGIDRGGDPTTANAIKNTADYAKQYDGPVVFKADYNVVLKADGKTLDTDKS